jgi:soluble lytic murein transglycosylase-like protein
MSSLLMRLQAEVEARKQPRIDHWPWSAIRGALLGCLLFLLAFNMGASSVVSEEAGWATEWQQRFLVGDARLRALEGKIDLQRMQIERLEKVHRYSARYGIPADLAASIQDIALSENIDPDLAFELVRVESGFKQTAVSPVGALGYTQLMPATARLLSPGISRQGILDRDTNLRLGFRFLRGMIRKYDGNLHLALLAYNRGPERVDQLLRAGENPSNGYSHLILRRVRGKK